MACSPPNPGTISNNSCNLAENCQFCIKYSEVESGWWKKVFALRSKVRPEWEVLGTAVGHRGPFKAFARPTTNTNGKYISMYEDIYWQIWAKTHTSRAPYVWNTEFQQLNVFGMKQLCTQCTWYLDLHLQLEEVLSYCLANSSWQLHCKPTAALEVGGRNIRHKKRTETQDSEMNNWNLLILSENN